MDFKDVIGQNKVRTDNADGMNEKNLPFGQTGGLSRMGRTECYGTDAGEEFDDSNVCLKAKGGNNTDILKVLQGGADTSILPRKVKGLSIRWGAIVDGIKVLYEDGETEIHGSSYGGREQCILLEEDDELEAIEGVWDVPYAGGGAIAGLLIRTGKGAVYGPFGGNNGKRFCVQVPENAAFAGLYGRAGKGGNGGFLEKLGLLYLNHTK